MKAIILISFLTLSLIAIASASQPKPRFNFDDRYNKFLDRHKKAHDKWDEAKKKRRNARFNHVSKIIAEHNANASAAYKMEINEFTDRDVEDYQKYLGANYTDVPSPRALPAMRPVATAAPPSLDYRPFAPPVRHQQGCGSCYAFATLAMLETYFKLRNIYVAPLSPQEIVDCDTYDLGCNGGLPMRLLSWLKNVRASKIAFETSYPYVSGVTKLRSPTGCKTTVSTNTVLPIKRALEFNAYTSEDAIKRILYAYGPLAIGICVPQACSNFFTYKTGVYNTPCECPQNTCGGMNHAVVLMGYGTDRVFGNYWIIRNSWGTTWGEAGYMRIARKALSILSLGCSMTGIDKTGDIY